MTTKADNPAIATTDGVEPGREDAADAPGAIKPNGQHSSYWILSEAERAKGFVRPVRRSYKHVGIAGPQFLTRELTPEEKERYAGSDYVRFEPYPEGSRTLGRFWTQAQLDKVGKGCGTVTTMSQEIAETYAREPGFYGGTFCVGCREHLPVGKDGEFVWFGSDERVGT